MTPSYFVCFFLSLIALSLANHTRRKIFKASVVRKVISSNNSLFIYVTLSKPFMNFGFFFLSSSKTMLKIPKVSGKAFMKPQEKNK